MGGRAGDRNPVSPEKQAPADWQVKTADAKPRNIRWSAVLGSHLLGGPVVADGLVWVGTNNEARDADPPDHAVLACLRESDGKLLYRYLSPRRGGFPIDWPRQSLSGSPLAEGDRLWFCTNRREVVCLDTGPLRRGTGEPRVVWKLDMVDTLKVHPRALMIPGPDTLGSPAAHGEFLYVPTGNGRSADNRSVPAPDAPSLACVRKDTGKVVWTDNSPGKAMLYGHYASPVVVEVAGRAQVIHPQADGWVRAFDAVTGKLIWKFDVNPKAAKGDRIGAPQSERVYVVATPVSAGGRVFFATGLDPEGCGPGPGRLFCVDPTRTGDVSSEVDAGPGRGKPNPNSAVVWEFTRAGPAEGDRMRLTLSSVAVHAGLVFAPDFMGHVHCLDANTGKRYWTHDTKDVVYGNPLVADGKVYVGTQEGLVWVLGAGKTKQVVGKFDMEYPVTAGPVFANGALYVMTWHHIYAIAAGPGGLNKEPGR